MEMTREKKDGLFQALTGLVQVVTLILLIHAVQAALSIIFGILKLFLWSSHPANLI